MNKPSADPTDPSPFGTLLTANTHSEAAAGAEIARKAFEPRTLMVEDPWGQERAVLLVPHGVDVHNPRELFADEATEPDRREGTATLADLESFVAHVKRFADEDSAIFMDPDPEDPVMVGVLDYHRKGAEGDPRFGKHRARYAFPLSDEWKAWTSKNGTTMSQADFASFVEDRITDLADPAQAFESVKQFVSTAGVTLATPARILELSRGLSVRATAKVAQAVNLASGEGTLAYEVEHTDSSYQPLKVPGAFLVALPVFRSGDVYQIAARLRYRLEGTRVVWSFVLFRPDRVFEDAIKRAGSKAVEATGLPLFVGTPEGER